MLGWVFGVVVAVVAFTLLSAVLPASNPSASQPTVGVIQMILGALLLLLAVRQWRGRPKAGVEPALPKWMGAIDSMTFWRGLGLGFLLAAVNPKNLMMAISAGLSIGAASLGVGQQVLVIVIFVIRASCTVAIPVIAYLVAAERMRSPLDSMRSWLTHNNATIMSVLLLVIGVVVVSKGIQQF